MFLALEMHSRLRRHIDLLMHIVPPAAAMLFSVPTHCQSGIPPLLRNVPDVYDSVHYSTRWPPWLPLACMPRNSQQDATSLPALPCLMQMLQHGARCILMLATSCMRTMSFDCIFIVTARARRGQVHHHGDSLAAQPLVPPTVHTRACSRLLHCIHPPMPTCSPCCF